MNNKDTVPPASIRTVVQSGRFFWHSMSRITGFTETWWYNWAYQLD